MANYNSQLQSNNTDLQTVLQTLQTKAAGGIVVDDVSKAIISRTITEINDDEIETVGSYTFAGCANLTTVSFPNATTIGSNAFYSCYSLTTANFPKVTDISNNTFCYCRSLTTANFPNIANIGSNVFYNCSNLTTVSFPNVTNIGSNVFYNCSRLNTASFPVVITIGSYAFNRCYNLSSLYLTGSSVCTLSNSNAFSSTPIGGYSAFARTYGSIYVPASLLTSYQTATNWTYFSSRFVAYDGGGDSGTIFEFLISGTKYQAEEGMTWGEWIDSEYNTNGFYADDNDVYGNHIEGFSGPVVGYDNYVSLNDIIISEGAYTILGGVVDED